MDPRTNVVFFGPTFSSAAARGLFLAWFLDPFALPGPRRGWVRAVAAQSRLIRARLPTRRRHASSCGRGRESRRWPRPSVGVSQVRFEIPRIAPG
jgi:hypothetical protein